MEKDKSLKNKAVDIKGKKYVLVADRIVYFNEQYPNGCITTEILSNNNMSEGETILMKATIYPDSEIRHRNFNAYSQEIVGVGYINKTSALENCETSAVGRALAMMGIGVIDSIASVDEITKAENRAVMPKFKPVLKEEQYNAMIDAINNGDRIKVMDSMEKYQIKKSYLEQLDKLLLETNNNPIKKNLNKLENEFLEGIDYRT
ncbi:MAG: hypothetical protein KKD48_02610 [Nanoarchaeota archaeon]|nr:hypothetical protein [Nanoarchaeota archaeon]